MGSLFAALGLKPPKKMLVAATADARDMELVDDGGGARWVDREVDEKEIAAFMAGSAPVARPGWGGRPVTGGKPATAGGGAADASKPSASGKPASSGAADPPAEKAGTAVVIPVSYSVKVGKKFKYLEIEKLKIEAELKFEDLGETGVVKTADSIGIGLDKGKLSPTRKIEIDLKKLKQLLLGEVQRDAQESNVKVDPKIECKVGPGEASVAIGVSVATGWYTGSAKFVAVAKETGKDMEFASFQVAPFGAQFTDKPIDLGGTKGKVSGKLTVGVVIKPEWGAIGVEVATKIGRPVATALVEALTVETAIAAGFVAGAAATVFAYVKSVTEWRDVRDCAQAAENGWLSFRAGFGSVYGLKWADGGAAELHKQGAAAAGGLLAARLKTTRARIQSERGALPANFDADYMATMKDLATTNPDGLGIWLQRSFRRQILEGFLRAYAQAHGDDTMYAQNARALRTLLGVGG